jgi:hypothetical protein
MLCALRFILIKKSTDLQLCFDFRLENRLPASHSIGNSDFFLRGKVDGG